MAFALIIAIMLFCIIGYLVSRKNKKKGSDGNTNFGNNIQKSKSDHSDPFSDASTGTLLKDLWMVKILIHKIFVLN